MIPARVLGTLEGEGVDLSVVPTETGVETTGAGLEFTLMGVVTRGGVVTREGVERDVAIPELGTGFLVGEFWIFPTPPNRRKYLQNGRNNP